MAEEKKRVAMVRCEFDRKGGIKTHSEFDCKGMDLMVFVGKTLKLVSGMMNTDPLNVAKKSIVFYNLAVDIKDDESENGEES